VILAADLNTVPHTRIACQLTQKYTDSFSKKGRGLGWTFMLADRLGVRIDYLLSSNDLVVTRHQVIKETKGVSDHFPILGCYRRVDGP
jgi:endonuclease/exonuclease/phosphatase (EEP) superfamily protein YafD